MEFKNYSKEYAKQVYELYCDFRDEDDFFKILTFEQFSDILFNNPCFDDKGNFICLDGDKLVGFGGALVRKEDEGNPKSSGYIHTFIVKKEYRRQGIGSKLLELCENYIKEKGKKSSRLVFLSPINWPWYIPNTNHHEHPGTPAIRINSEFYVFLYHHDYFVNSIHEGFHLPLSEYELPESVVKKMEENNKKGLYVEVYDPKKHYGVEEFCKKIESSNSSFANAIRSNMNKKEPKPFLCANQNGKMVGWTGAMWNEESGRGHFDGIIVDEDIRGTGLGKALFCYLCYQSKLNGAKYMTFFTGLDNPARYIYLHAGFKVAQSFADMKKNF